MHLIYHPDAEAELIEAAEFYEQRVAGLGQQFLQEFDLAIVKIAQAPDRWRAVEDDIRRYLLPHFPYGIYYRASDDELRILVVKHLSRHPDHWKYRHSQ